jgi:hypothetical protein
MVRINKNPNWENNIPKKDVTFEDIQNGNDIHINNVMDVMDFLADEIKFRGELHDCTKKSQEQLYYRCYMDNVLNGADFTQSDWYKMHIQAERHHLHNNCPEDVNFIDIIEMISDWVCAGLSRSGEVHQLDLSDDILRKAFYNTVEYVKNSVELVENKNRLPVVEDMGDEDNDFM